MERICKLVANGLLLSNLVAIQLFAQQVTLVPFGALWKYYKATKAPDWSPLEAWLLADFDDQAWNEGPAPLGYKIGGELGIATDLGSSLQEGYLTVYLRKAIQIDNPFDYSQLLLHVRVDDGCVVWLNGNPVARFNAPDGIPSFDSTAPTANGSVPAELTFTISNAWTLLRPGINIVAVHLLNANWTSSDLFFDAELTGIPNSTPPTVVLIDPPPGSVLRHLYRIEVRFNRPVEGVEASDLLINGLPATDIRFGEPGQFVFIFDEPPAGLVEVQWAEDHGITDTTSWHNAFEGGKWTYLIDPTALLPLLRINELMASNKKTIRDEDGDTPDWIELYNAGEYTEDLEGWFITNDTNNLAKWRFPKISIPPHGYLVLFASGKNRTNSASFLHTNFRLSAEGGFVAIVDPETNVVSQIFYPQAYEDVSYGVDQVDPRILGYFLQPTPGGPNASAGRGFAPRVKFSVPSCTFFEPFTVELSVDSPDATIYYTLDGSLPTEQSVRYTAPITIDRTVQLRARAYQTGYFPGPPATAIYMRLSPTITNFSSNLPIIILDNFGAGNVPSSPVSKRQPVAIAVFAPKENGRVSLLDQPILLARGGINIRGSSTKGFPKPSYRLEFWDELDLGKPVPLLDLPADPDWILYAPNFFDLPLIHNPLAYYLSNEIGQYASRHRFVEVFLNTGGGPISWPVPREQYRGIYVLLEAIKRDDYRVNVEELLPQHTSEPEITGGYLLKIDRRDPDERSFNAGSLEIIYQYPPGVEMVTPQRQAQAQFIRDYINRMYSAICGPNPEDPANGYPAYIDILSWIDHHILNVVALNVDALRLSAYLFKPRNCKLHMGPIWDFDRSMGTSQGGDLRPFNPLSWMGANPLGGGSDYGTDFFNPNNVFPNPWYGQLFKRSDFWQLWIDRYQILRAAQLSTEHICSVIDWMALQLLEAQPRDLQRWAGSGASDPSPRRGTVKVPGYSYNFPGTYAGEIEFLKQWFRDRLHFIDTNLLSRPKPSRPSGFVSKGARIELTDTSQEEGTTIYYTTDGKDPRQQGGEVAPSATLYREPITISSNTLLIARAYNAKHRNLTGQGNPPISSPWSGPTVLYYRTDPQTVVINEWMARNTRSLIETNTNDYADWIELYNATDQPIDLSNYFITDRLWEPTRFSFPEGTIIQPHSFLLLFADGRTNLNAPGKPVHLPFALNAEGSAIGIFTPTLQPVDVVVFGPQQADISQGRWPDAAPPPFYSFPSPTPGFPNTPPHWPTLKRSESPFKYGCVVINEWMAVNRTTLQDPLDGEYKDWVELFNTTSTPIDLSGWSLTDQLDNPRKWVFPQGTTIAAKGFLLVWTDGKPELTVPGQSLHTNFKLSQNGEAIGLYAPDGAMIDLVIFGPQQQPDVSQGRRPDGCAGPYISLIRPTPGAPNIHELDRPRVSFETVGPNKLLLRWAPVPGIRYKVQYCDRLESGNWLDLSTELATPGADMTCEVDIVPTVQTRFFRVVGE